ncbi:MAG: penicillin-binding transpeptidase domain-containing protein [Terriglobales bacterium]
MAAALLLPVSAQARSQRRGHIRRVRYTRQTWTAKPVAYGLGADDVTAGEDPVLRQAAVQAMGDLNGTAVVVDPNTGRILAMVNQGLALSAQYQPCSTTKMAVALAALDHGVVTENQPVRIARHDSVTMVKAMAYSINAYFEALGRRMGFDAVTDFEREVGLGERAGWNIPGEDPGKVPTQPGPGGVSKLSSFGQGVYISPLQLAALVTAIANGGTLYYLQHPTTREQVADFVPRVKRRLNIANFTPVVKDGMLAAVLYGTARGARQPGEQILGKTGTCSRDGTRFGLFASYLGIEHPQVVVVVILRGNGSVSGPRAADIAGRIYAAFDRKNIFSAEARPSAWPALILPYGGY